MQSQNRFSTILRVSPRCLGAPVRVKTEVEARLRDQLERVLAA